MSYPDQATASLAQFLFRDSAGAMYIIPRRAFHNGAEYGDTVTLVQDLSGNGHDLTGTAVFDRRSFYGGNRPLDNVRDAPFVRDVNMSAPVSGMGTTIRAVPGGTVMFDEGALDGTITGEFSVLILIDRTLSEREKHVVSELARLWGGANWTPGALFMAGKDGVWLDPSDHSTLWIDEARTQNATQPGDVVWWIDDKSGNENHFSVDASANRSRLVRWPASAVREGYVRNRLINTDDLTAPQWLPRRVEVTAALEDPVRGAFMIRDSVDEGAVLHGLQTAGNTAGAAAQNTVLLKAGTMRYVLLNHASSSDATSRRVIVDLVDGTILDTAGAEGAIEEAGNGWWRVSNFSLDQTGATASRGLQVQLLSTSSVESRLYQGDGTGTIYIAQPSRVITDELVDPTPYQRVGAGHWDVTEEGQPDCWGIEANGINNRYVSERGIPEYEDGKVRMLVGQTKFNEAGNNSPLVTNRETSSQTGRFVVLAPSGAGNQYSAIYRGGSSDLSRADNNDSEYSAPNSAILDVTIDDRIPQVSLRINQSPTALSNIGEGGSLSDSSVGLMADNRDNFNGIIWSLILTAYAPDETLWDRVARDWLNHTNMPGVLDDD